MKSDRIAVELAERLQPQGVYAPPTDVDAFVSGLPAKAGDLDAKALAERYLEEDRPHVRQTRPEFAAVVIGGVGLLTVGLICLVGPLVPLLNERPSMPSGDAAVLAGLLAAAGLSLLVDGMLPYLRFWRARRVERLRRDRNAHADSRGNEHG